MGALKAMKMSNSKYAPRNIPKVVFLLPFALLVIVVLLSLNRNLSRPSFKIYAGSLETTETRRCNIFSGHWAPYTKDKETYYDNETCPFIENQVNCLTSGRPDKEFIKLRWKPNDCDLPLFDATQFMRLVRGKSLAFVGDSMGKNQMVSLMCLINSVAHPKDVSSKHKSMVDGNFKWWFSAEYNFTATILWSPFLVKANVDPNGWTNLYLDEADKAWASELENFDYVIISTGQWFFRPLIFYENGQLVGSQKGSENNITELNFYGYRNAFRTTFKTIRNLQGFNGLTFFVTQSPKHFENGEWYDGGACDRTKPFTKVERHIYKYEDILKALYQIQVEEFTAIEKEARKKGLHFDLIDITEAMTLRPDGHPGRYVHMIDKDKRINDCVHWCSPGPVDTWNEFLLYMMKLEKEITDK